LVERYGNNNEVKAGVASIALSFGSPLSIFSPDNSKVGFFKSEVNISDRQMLQGRIDGQVNLMSKAVAKPKSVKSVRVKPKLSLKGRTALAKTEKIKKGEAKKSSVIRGSNLKFNQTSSSLNLLDENKTIKAYTVTSENNILLLLLSLSSFIHPDDQIYTLRFCFLLR
jgi:hypothetical protein